jgi:hypothetical protein
VTPRRRRRRRDARSHHRPRGDSTSGIDNAIAASSTPDYSSGSRSRGLFRDLWDDYRGHFFLALRGAALIVALLWAAYCDGWLS